MPQIKVRPLSPDISQTCNAQTNNKQEVSHDTLYAPKQYYIKLKVLDELCQHFKSTPETFKRIHNFDLSKLLFYRLVQGGYIKLITEVLNEVQRKDPDWHKYLLTGETPFSKQSDDKTCSQRTLKCWYSIFVWIITYLFILVPIFIVTTPFFYMIHPIGYGDKRKLCKAIRLPLVFATLSRNERLVKLFVIHRPNILVDTDKDGNNVFHYLADMSIKNPKRSIQCLELLLKVFDRVTIRYVLMELKNTWGFTALEMSVYEGSPVYFTYLLETRGILKFTSLAISENYMHSNQPHMFDVTDKEVSLSIHNRLDSFDGSNTNSDLNEVEDTIDPRYQITHYDVTKYEHGDIAGDNSFLLTLFTSRDLMNMSNFEVDSITKCSLLMKWMIIKRKAVPTLQYLQCCCEFILAILCTLYTSRMNDGNHLDSLVVLFWDTISNLAQLNSTEKLLSLEASSILQSLVPSTLNSMSAACGFNVSQLANRDNYSISFSSPTLETGSVVILATVIVLSSIFILVTDIAFRLVFLTRHFFTSGWTTATGMRNLGLAISRVSTRPMQANGVTRQLSILSSICLSAMLCCFHSNTILSAESVHTANVKSYFRSAGMLFAVAGTCFRYFTYIYILRSRAKGNLMSRFALTLCKMFSFIVEFSFLYVLISVFFASLFILIVHDPNCPAIAIYPFDSWFNSMIGVFKMMLGNSMLPDQMNMESLLAYVVYTVLTTIVILSLVTGISGGIADRVLSRRMAKILLNVETLKDSIDVESTSFIYFYPFYRWLHKWRIMSEKKLIATFDNRNVMSKVFIEVESSTD